ncbi:hypothetical protein HY620_00590 [Candidatus Uhrbacteria bacterium]|nr:hypothetical protein [Candidatus Uhrbacteria bacterium]
MALEASHIRFALDLKEKYHVTDIQRYLSGTLYPDSRYSTGIARRLTHPNEGIFGEDDFKKGWQAHLMVDDIQLTLIRNAMPDVFGGEIRQNSDEWVKLTAIKVLQDIDDCKKFDIARYLSFVAENPNNEDIEVIKKYNNVVSEMYSRPESINIDSYSVVWKVFGLSEELAEKITTQTEEYSADERVMQLVASLYGGVLEKIQTNSSL